MQGALDSGMFDQHSMFEEQRGEDDSDNKDPLHACGHQLYLSPPPPMSPQPSAALPPLSRQHAAQLLTVSVPVYGAKGAEKNKTVTTTLVLPYNIPPLDFFPRVQAQMNVDPATAVLGWKESSEPGEIRTIAFSLRHLLALQTSTRRKKPVVMEVTNLEVQPDAPWQEQMVLCDAAHECTSREACGGRIDIVSLWARKMKDSECDEDCVEPPKILQLDGLQSVATCERSATHGRGQPNLPPIHVHVGPSSNPGGALRDVKTNMASKCSQAESLEDDSDDDDDVLTILDVLRELDTKYPHLKYLQYAGSLQAQGIVYARSALDFDRAYYKQTRNSGCTKQWKRVLLLFNVDIVSGAKKGWKLVQTVCYVPVFLTRAVATVKLSCVLKKN
ncbi:hypothetical protein B0H10DRAFT_1963228 [Mycena sp. CBHHK59/15]|nr:hypothetical protein B0H10DRAFT_1963228 [Mycena sp. CBHHK59/15]